MSSKLSYTVQESPLAVVVSGSTFPYKEQLKALGGTWDPSRKVWLLLNQKSPSAIREQLESVHSEANFRQETKEPARKRIKKDLQNSPEEKRARVLEALKEPTKYYWVCCENCEVIDWREAFTYCKVHAEGENAFRLRGHIFDGS